MQADGHLRIVSTETLPAVGKRNTDAQIARALRWDGVWQSSIRSKDKGMLDLIHRLSNVEHEGE